MRERNIEEKKNFHENSSLREYPRIYVPSSYIYLRLHPASVAVDETKDKKNT